MSLLYEIASVSRPLFATGQVWDYFHRNFGTRRKLGNRLFDAAKASILCTMYKLYDGNAHGYVRSYKSNYYLST